VGKNSVFYEPTLAPTGRVRNHLTILLSNLGEVLVHAWNEIPISLVVGRSSHSEEVAINKLIKLIRAHRIDEKIIRKGIYVVNFAFNQRGAIKISRPCLRCSKLLCNSTIKILGIYWTESDPLRFGYCKVKDVLIGATPSSGDL
jgi:hypothetical protein